MKENSIHFDIQDFIKSLIIKESKEKPLLIKEIKRLEEETKIITKDLEHFIYQTAHWEKLLSEDKVKQETKELVNHTLKVIKICYNRTETVIKKNEYIILLLNQVIENF